ncbi:MAG: SoxR reducing system RseC family protein [Candidatus Omnitrophica bacterium]|nr:SoxR reducing system RseC family protein [Candidatus Omnitrophota bacterium]
MKIIKHPAIVKEIRNNSILAETQQIASCPSCHGQCQSKSECSTIQIEIECDPKQFKLNDKLDIIMKPVINASAFWLAGIIPLFTLIVTQIINAHLNRPKLLWSITGASLLIYGLSLFFLFKKTQTQFTVSVEKP